jgi:hypothetical protein
MALGMQPSDLGVTPAGPHVPFGAIMEMAYPQAVVTLVCFQSGDASLYVSNGGGMIGGGEHEAISAAAKAFVSFASEFVAQMPSADPAAPLAPGMTAFYLLTQDGIFGSAAPHEDLGRNRSAFSPLFYAAQHVITALREHMERQPPA